MGCVAGDGGGGRLRDLRVLRHGAAGHADCADQFAVGASQRHAAAKRRQTAVRELEGRCGRAGLAVLPDGFAVGLEQGGGACLLQRDVDRPEHRAVHAAEGLQMHAGIDDGDDDGHADG